MPQQNIQKFMVCALDDINNPGPEPERQHLVQSIVICLESRGIQLTAKEEDAHLVIIAPRQEDVFLTLDDLRFFHCLLPGKSKKVLYTILPFTVFLISKSINRTDQLSEEPVKRTL